MNDSGIYVNSSIIGNKIENFIMESVGKIII